MRNTNFAASLSSLLKAIKGSFHNQKNLAAALQEFAPQYNKLGADEKGPVLQKIADVVAVQYGVVATIGQRGVTFKNEEGERDDPSMAAARWMKRNLGLETPNAARAAAAKKTPVERVVDAFHKLTAAQQRRVLALIQSA